MARKASVVVALAVLAAGCGAAHRATPPPPPKLPHDLAAQLASLSDQVGAQLDGGDACAALATARQLDTRTVEAIGTGQVPAPLRQPLRAATDDLVGQIQCTPPPPKEHGKGKDHGKRKGHGGGGD